MSDAVYIDLPLDCSPIDYVVRAKVVDVAPHLAHVASFAVHKNPYVFHGFRVSNIETGAALGKADRPTQAGAIKAARDLLATKTPDEVVRAMRKLRRAKR